MHSISQQKREREGGGKGGEPSISNQSFHLKLQSTYETWAGGRVGEESLEMYMNFKKFQDKAKGQEMHKSKQRNHLHIIRWANTGKHSLPLTGMKAVYYNFAYILRP